MSEQMVRGGAAAALELVLEVAIGAGMLCLFVLALAWDPIDRRLGFHARRREERMNGRSSEPIQLNATGATTNGVNDGAYGIAPAVAA